MPSLTTRLVFADSLHKGSRFIHLASDRFGENAPREKVNPSHVVIVRERNYCGEDIGPATLSFIIETADGSEVVLRCSENTPVRVVQPAKGHRFVDAEASKSLSESFIAATFEMIPGTLYSRPATTPTVPAYTLTRTV